MRHEIVFKKYFYSILFKNFLLSAGCNVIKIPQQRNHRGLLFLYYHYSIHKPLIPNLIFFFKPPLHHAHPFDTKLVWRPPTVCREPSHVRVERHPGASSFIQRLPRLFSIYLLLPSLPHCKSLHFLIELSVTLK